MNNLKASVLNRILTISAQVGFALLLTACGQQATYERNFATTQAPEEYSSYQMDAQYIFNSALASGELNPKESAVAKRARDMLRQAKIYSVGEDPVGHCGPRTVAFVLTPNDKSEIFICPTAGEMTQYYMIQVLVHESIHLGGILTECEAVDLELRVMRAAGRYPEYSSYVSECGLY
jgi:hypothetical protein